MKQKQRDKKRNAPKFADREPFAKRWAVLDETTGDGWEHLFYTREEAERFADEDWNSLTEHDKKRRVRYYIAEVTLDEDGCADYESILEIAKEYVWR